MPGLIEIRQELLATAEALKRLESIAAKEPMSFSMSLTADALQKRNRELQEELNKALSEQFVDVCKYRMFLDAGTPNVLASARALAEFQHLVSHVYDVLRGGPKERARTSPEAVKDTSFHIGYVFPGSLGFALTLQTEPHLFEPSSPVDMAIGSIFLVAQSRSEEATAEFAKHLGASVVRLIHKWVSIHLEYWMGMDIQWGRGNAIRSKLFLQQKELKQLKDVIERTTEKTEDDVTIQGTYVGGDVAKQTVHIEVPDAADIMAGFHETFDPAQLPKDFWTPVTAQFKKRITLHLVTEKEDIKYFITGIKQRS